MTETRCQGCTTWFDKKLRTCPDCGCPIGAYNPHQYTAKLNNHLYAQAESADRQNKLYAAIRSGREPDPPRWARQAARKIVADW